MSSLQSKAMLTTLSISQWTARKQDKKVTNEVESSHGAHDAGKFHKSLVNKELLDPIAKIASRARDYHYNMTLPWSNSGQYLLPSALFVEYTTKFRGFKAEFEKAVNTMVSSYPAEVQEARNRLGTMYNPGDYPDPSELYMRFGIKTEFTPIPDGDDFRLTVSAEDQAELRASVVEAIHERQAAAVKATYGRIRDVVSKVEERLSDPKAIFKDSLITNVSDLCAVLGGLNITDDPVIESLRQDIEANLLVSTHALRISSHHRTTTAAHASRILASLP